MKKKSLFVVLPRIPYPLEKGDKLRAYYFIKGLKAHYDITIFALYKGRYDTETVSQIEAIAGRYYFYRITILSVLIQAVKALFTGIPFQAAYFYQSAMRRKIKRMVHDEKPDAVLCQLVRSAVYAKGLPCNTILDFQDTLSLGMKRRAEKSTGLARWFYQAESRRLLRYEKKAANWFRHTIIISEQDRDALPCVKEKVVVVPNGVDTDHYCPKDGLKDKDLLFVGNMSYAPNIDAMEYFTSLVMPSVVTRFPDAELVIAGAKPHGRIKMLASDHVIVSGWVDDLRDYYNRARVFVAPMQMGTGLQNKLLEAMSMELPCVTTSLANNALGARHGEEILVADSPEDWIDAVVMLMENEDLRRRIASNAKRFVLEKYSWSSRIEQLMSVIDR